MPRLLPIALLAAAVALVASLLMLEPGTPAEAGTFHVIVRGPEGEMHNGTVEIAGATAYTVLVAAASGASWDVEATGHAESLFVVRIGAYRNHGADGWCYAVSDEGGWRRPPHSAGVAGLQDGQAVLWSYERGGCGALSGP